MSESWERLRVTAIETLRAVAKEMERAAARAEANMAMFIKDSVAAAENPLEISLLSERALAEDWDRPEEREAWAYLQKEDPARE